MPPHGVLALDREAGGEDDVTACLRCGFDPQAAIAASWSFAIERPVVSLNARSTNRGSRATIKAYQIDRTAWAWHLRAQRLAQGISIAHGFRRVTLTRIYGKGQRALDVDNLVGGLKLVVDAMVREGLLAGDSPRLATIHYGQSKGPLQGIGVGLQVVIEELAADRRRSA